MSLLITKSLTRPVLSIRTNSKRNTCTINRENVWTTSSLTRITTGQDAEILVQRTASEYRLLLPDDSWLKTRVVCPRGETDVVRWPTDSAAPRAGGPPTDRRSNGWPGRQLNVPTDSKGVTSVFYSRVVRLYYRDAARIKRHQNRRIASRVLCMLIVITVAYRVYCFSIVFYSLHTCSFDSCPLAWYTFLYSPVIIVSFF